MKIRVKLFASVKEIVGKSEMILDVPDGTRASALPDRLATAYPAMRALALVLKIAVNHEYADGERVLVEGDEVALLPPVSGGADVFEITEAPLSLDALARAVGQDSCGAIAGFLGVVRGFARGRRIRHLEYDAYPEMAIAKMRQIGDEIRARWPVDRIAMAHRVGRLGVGEASVAIVAASPHRQEALQACAYAIERLKEIVPIWKKEVWSDGAEWIGSTVDEHRMERQEADRAADTSARPSPPPVANA